MPDDLKALTLSRDEVDLRHRYLRRAIESARIEGGEVDPEDRAIIDLYCTGGIDSDEAAARIRERYVIDPRRRQALPAERRARDIQHERS